VTRYLLSRVLLACCVFLALRASLYAATGHASLLPVVLWMLAAAGALLICPESPEEVTE
jgi:hypothetical protein